MCFSRSHLCLRKIICYRKKVYEPIFLCNVFLTVIIPTSFFTNLSEGVLKGPDP